jgi:hypothetical protein
MRAVIEGLIVTPFTGEPTRDWLAVKAVIRGCGNPAISGI